MKATTFLKWIGLVVVIALAYAVYKLGWSVIESGRASCRERV